MPGARPPPGIGTSGVTSEPLHVHQRWAEDPKLHSGWACRTHRKSQGPAPGHTPGWPRRGQVGPKLRACCERSTKCPQALGLEVHSPVPAQQHPERGWAEKQEGHPALPFWCPDRLPVAVPRTPPLWGLCPGGGDALPHIPRSGQHWPAAGDTGHRTPLQNSRKANGTQKPHKAHVNKLGQPPPHSPCRLPAASTVWEERL